MQVYRAAFIICLIDSLSVYVNNLFGPPGMFGLQGRYDF